MFNNDDISTKALVISIFIPIKIVLIISVTCIPIIRKTDWRRYFIISILMIFIVIYAALLIVTVRDDISCQCSDNILYSRSLCGDDICKLVTEVPVIVLIITIMEFLFFKITLQMRIKKSDCSTTNMFFGNNKIPPSPTIILANQKSITMETFPLPPEPTYYDLNSNIVGIDFGTTEYCAAVIRADGPTCVAMDLVTGLRTLPSYVAYDERKPKCGQIVIDRMRHQAKYSIFDAKKLLGIRFENIKFDPAWPFNIINQTGSIKIELETPKGTLIKTPESVLGDILKHIKQRLDEFQNKLHHSAVITIPSSYSEKQKNALLRAAKFAEWKHVYLIPEPVAAACGYYNQMELPNNSNTLVFDFGGGTLDVSVLQLKKEKFKFFSFTDNDLGGRYLDQLIYKYFDEILYRQHNIDVSKIDKAYLLLQKCHEIKHTLSVNEAHWLDVSDFDCNSDEQIYITRHDFEVMATSIKNRIINVIHETIKSANLKRDEINYVLQVGGSSRMPMIKNLLEEMFSTEKLKCCKNPDWIVAEGAALYGYYAEHDAKQI